MSHTGFSWSDDQQSAPPAVKAQGSQPFAWSDEQQQPKAAPGNTPGTITGDTAEMRAAPSVEPKPFRKFQGPFIERAASQFGEDLNQPKNFLPSWHMLLGGPGISYDAAKQAYETYQHRNDPPPDPAESVGHLGVPLLGALVTHGADALGNPMEAAPIRPEPAWKSAPSSGTEVPSILNRQPYAQPARIAVPPMEAAPIRQPGQAGSMAQSVVEPAPQPAVDPILSRLRVNASRIAEEGHGDEEGVPDESTPITTNLNDDLTPALKASLRKVRAAKGRVARAN